MGRHSKLHGTYARTRAATAEEVVGRRHAAIVLAKCLQGWNGVLRAVSRYHESLIVKCFLRWRRKARKAAQGRERDTALMRGTASRGGSGTRRGSKDRNPPGTGTGTGTGTGIGSSVPESESEPAPVPRKTRFSILATKMKVHSHYPFYSHSHCNL